MSLLPYTAKDVFKLRPADWLLYTSVIAFARATGIWRYPVAASGDFESMTLLDKIYWLYKAQFPVEKAARGWGLEALFQNHAHFEWGLPPGLIVERELVLTAVGDLMDHPFLDSSRGYFV